MECPKCKQQYLVDLPRCPICNPNRDKEKAKSLIKKLEGFTFEDSLTNEYIKLLKLKLEDHLEIHNNTPK